MKKNPVSRLRDVLTRDGGFTLIEVLGVMVIVGLLAAIAVIGVGKWREKAALTSMKTDARNVGLQIAREDAVPTAVDSDGHPFHRLSENNTLAAYSADRDTEDFSFEIHSTKTGKAICYSSITGTPRICEGEETTTTGSIFWQDGQVHVRLSGFTPGVPVSARVFVGLNGEEREAGPRTFTPNAEGVVEAALGDPGMRVPITIRIEATQAGKVSHFTADLTPTG